MERIALDQFNFVNVHADSLEELSVAAEEVRNHPSYIGRVHKGKPVSSQPQAPQGQFGNTPQDFTTNIAPNCQKCGKVMVKRTAKSGKNAGGQFWGCSGYPTCKNTMPV